MVSKAHLEKHVDTNFIDAILECNKKGLVTVDACAGYGDSKNMSGRLLSKRHVVNDFPYVTFDKVQTDTKTYNRLANSLKGHTALVHPIFHKERLFDIVSYKKRKLKSFVGGTVCHVPAKHRIGLNDAFVCPLFMEFINKTQYSRTIYHLKKRWHRIFYEAIKEM